MDNNYVSCWIHGGIGNQLFQIANTLEYANKYNKTPIFKDELNLWNFHGLERKTAWNTLFSNKLTVFKDNIYDLIKFDIYHELRYNMYDEIPYLNENAYFKGYFQSPKYFSEETRKNIEKLVYSNTIYTNIAKFLYNSIKKEFNDNDDNNYVFIHIRRTDYVNNCTHNLLNIDYYKKGLDIIGNNKIAIIFSDDIEWCKNYLDFIPKKYFVNINNLYIELILMSYIKNGIIANSTFSWWGSYLGDKDNKKIIAPNQWFATTSHIKEWEDIYIKEWIRI